MNTFVAKSSFWKNCTTLNTSMDFPASVRRQFLKICHQCQHLNIATLKSEAGLGH